MTNGEKLEKLYKEFFTEPLPSNMEDKKNKIKRKLSKIFHTDLIATLSPEILEERLNIAKDVLTENKMNNYSDIIETINTMLDDFELEFGTEQKKLITKEEALNNAKEIWDDFKEQHQEFSGIISYKYKMFEKSMKRVKDDDTEKILSLYYGKYNSMIVFLASIELNHLELKNLLETLKDLISDDKKVIEKYNSEFQQFEIMIYEQDPNHIKITSNETFDDAYIPLYSSLKKEITIDILQKREYTFLNDSSIYYDTILESLYRDINAIQIDRDDKQWKEKFEQKIEDTLKEYRIKILKRNFVVTCYEQLRNKITSNGFSVDTFGIDISPILEIEDINQCKNLQIKLDEEITFRISKLKAIKTLKDKYNSNNSYISNLLNDFVFKISKSEVGDSILYYVNIAEKRLNYAVYVNSQIDEYLEDIRNNSRYSFSYDDIIRTFDKLRSYYNQHDSNYQIFNIEFCSLKNEIESKVDDDLVKAQSKKESLTSKISDDFENGIFISNHLSDICNRINEVKTFGGFGGLYNEIIKDELCNVLDNVKNLLIQSLYQHSEMKVYHVYVDQAIKLLNEIEKNITEEKNISNSKIWGMNYKKLSKNIQCLGYNDCLSQFLGQESLLELLNSIYIKYCSENKKTPSTIKK